MAQAPRPTELVWPPPFASTSSQSLAAHTNRGSPQVQLKGSFTDLFPQNQFYGLRVLYTPPMPEVDIIFTHGLIGNPFTTWVASTGTYWPTQLLPLDMPHARILSFGYDADVTRFLGPVGQNNVREHAATLISDLAAVRAQDHSENRPIIHVVHSLGGLVTKKALCLSEQAVETHEKQLNQYTIAVAFLGTPHRGSGLAPFATGVARILKAAHKRVNTKILALLQRDSEVLADIEASFGVWLRRNGARFNLTCFFEEHELRGTGMVVTKESAKISGYPQLPIPANHRDMTKFSSSADVGYWRVLGELRRWVQHNITEELQSGLMQSLYFPEQNERGIDIERATRGTCEWLLEHILYKQWLSCGRGLLWIKGKPGAGKSTLMKHSLLENNKHESFGYVSTISFFFHGRGTELQKTPVGLFRALLYQLGEKAPNSLRKLAKVYKTRTKYARPWAWRAQELEDYLVDSVLPSLLQIKPLRIFIDALDECGDTEARKLVRCFSRLNDRSTTFPHGLSICFSCRHYPVIAPDMCNEICVEHENDKDISIYIQKELGHAISNTEELLILERKVEERSQHVFQWVILVVPRIAWLYQEGKTLSQILAFINTMPKELDNLYATILEDLLQHSPSQSVKLLQWICFGFKSFTITELRCVMNVDALQEKSGQSFEEWAKAPDYIETDEQMRRQLRSLSGGLVEQTEFGVQLIHQSVQDCLLERGFSILDPLLVTNNSSVIGKAHYRLARSCLVYFLAARRECMFKMHKFNFAELEAWAAKFPLLKYAIQQWLPHARAAEENGISQKDLLDYLPGRSGLAIEHWALIMNVLDDKEGAKETTPRPGTTILHEAVRFELMTLIPTVLEWFRINVRDQSGQTPLSVAARTSVKMTNFLLSQNDILVNVKDVNGMTPLTIALESGSEDAAMALVRHPGIDLAWHMRCNVARQSPTNWRSHHLTALDFAINKSFVTMTKLMLSQSSIVDYDPAETVWRALWKGNASVLESVLEFFGESYRLGVSPPWFYAYPSALHYIARQRDESLAAILLKRRDVDVNLTDDSGSTPLHYAIRNDRDVARLLVENCLVDVNCKNKKGQTPLLLAVEIRMASKIKLLLDCHRVDPNLGDLDGRTPFWYAIRQVDNHTARQLLARADFHINLRDIAGLRQSICHLDLDIKSDPRIEQILRLGDEAVLYRIAMRHDYMELELIGAAVGPADKAAQMSIALNKICHCVGPAAEEIQSLALELQFLAAQINWLSQRLENNSSGCFSALNSNIASIMESCGNIYSEIYATILSFHGNKYIENWSNLQLYSLSTCSRVRWLVGQRRVSRLRDCVQSIRSKLVLALEGAQIQYYQTRTSSQIEFRSLFTPADHENAMVYIQDTHYYKVSHTDQSSHPSVPHMSLVNPHKLPMTAEVVLNGFFLANKFHRKTTLEAALASILRDTDFETFEGHLELWICGAPWGPPDYRINDHNEDFIDLYYRWARNRLEPRLILADSRFPKPSTMRLPPALKNPRSPIFDYLLSSEFVIQQEEELSVLSLMVTAGNVHKPTADFVKEQVASNPNLEGIWNFELWVFDSMMPFSEWERQLQPFERPMDVYHEWLDLGRVPTFRLRTDYPEMIDGFLVNCQPLEGIMSPWFRKSIWRFPRLENTLKSQGMTSTASASRLSPHTPQLQDPPRMLPSTPSPASSITPAPIPPPGSAATFPRIQLLTPPAVLTEPSLNPPSLPPRYPQSKDAAPNLIPTSPVPSLISTLPKAERHSCQRQFTSLPCPLPAPQYNTSVVELLHLFTDQSMYDTSCKNYEDLRPCLEALEILLPRSVVLALWLCVSPPGYNWELHVVNREETMEIFKAAFSNGYGPYFELRLMEPDHERFKPFPYILGPEWPGWVPEEVCELTYDRFGQHVILFEPWLEPYMPRVELCLSPLNDESEVRVIDRNEVPWQLSFQRVSLSLRLKHFDIDFYSLSPTRPLRLPSFIEDHTFMGLSKNYEPLPRATTIQLLASLYEPLRTWLDRGLLMIYISGEELLPLKIERSDDEDLRYIFLLVTENVSVPFIELRVNRL